MTVSSDSLRTQNPSARRSFPLVLKAFRSGKCFPWNVSFVEKQAFSLLFIDF
jgi:hypothetical protein